MWLIYIGPKSLNLSTALCEGFGYDFFYKLKNIEKLSKLSHFKVSFTILPCSRKLCQNTFHN